MRLGNQIQNRLTLTFEYWVQKAHGEELMARGEQTVACMRREGSRLVATRVPESLQEAASPLLRISVSRTGPDESATQPRPGRERFRPNRPRLVVSGPTGSPRTPNAARPVGRQSR